MRGWACVLALLALPGWAQDKPRLVVQRGHGGSNAITSLAWSADGRYLLTGSWDYTAILWDAATHKQLRRFSGHTAGITSVALSTDGRRAYTCGADNSVRFWDLTTGKELRRFTEFKAFQLFMAYSPGGRRVLVSGGADLHEMRGRLLHERTGKVTGQLFMGDRSLKGMAYSANGRRILALSDALMPILLFNAKGKQVHRLKGHEKPVVAGALSPDGRRALTGSEDGVVILWDTGRGRELKRFQAARGEPLAFSPDGKRILMGNRGSVRDVRTGDELFVLEKDPPEGDIKMVAAFSPDGDRIATARYTATVWDAGTGEQLGGFGEGLALSTWGLDVSPDGRNLLIGSGGGGAGAYAMWDLVGGTQGWSVQAGKDAVAFVDFAPVGGRALADGSRIWVFDAATKTPKGDLSQATNLFSGAVFSPDGKRLAASSSGSLRIFDAATAARVRSIDGGGPHAWSPDGRLLVGARAGIVRLWDAASGKEVQHFKAKKPTSVAFFPDGKRVFVGEDSGAGRAWNILTGRPVRTFKGHSQRVTDARFSPDGKLLLTTSMDTTARIWSARTGRLIRTLRGHAGWVRQAAFAGGVSRVISAGFDGVRVWNAETGKQLCHAISFLDGSWAVLDAEGRFDASNGGSVAGLHWVYREEPISLDQLKERYYDPGLLAKYLGFNKEPLRKVASFELPELFPVVTLKAPGADSATLGIGLKDRGGGIGRVVVKVNGKEVTDDARAPGTSAHAKSLQLDVDLANDPRVMPGETNFLEVEVYNADGYLRSRGLRVPYRAPGEKSKDKAKLWGIVVGTADYAGDKIDLRYASKDAADFAKALEIAGKGLLGEKRVKVTLLANAGRAELAKALRGARKAKPRDIVVLYLAGHGVNHGGEDDGDFYYLTKDAMTADLSDPAVRKRVALSSRELTKLLNRIPAQKQVLILDTCSAGRFIEKLTEKRNVPSSQIRALERLKDRTGLHVLAGCAADRVSYEATRFAQGLLTHSLLLGMRGAALREGEFVDVLTLFGFAVDRVPQLAGSIGGVQRPVMATPKAGASFDIGQLDDEAKLRVPLRTPRPLVLRSNFQDEDQLEDVLELGRHVDRRLNEASARGTEARLVFVDARALPDACRIAGRYRVEGDKVVVDLRLSRGKQRLARFEVSGAASALDKLAARIVAETEGRLK
jgi:WD40 repeat protein